MKTQGSSKRNICNLATLSVSPRDIYQDVTAACELDVMGE